MTMIEMLTRVYYGILTGFGTKKKVDEINRRNLDRAREGKRLVILLHGMFGNYYRSMYSAIGFLKKEGIDVVSVGYDYNRSVDVSAKKLGVEIERLMQVAGVESVDIIALCSSGLIARYYAEEFGGSEKIKKFVTVYSPTEVISPSEFGFKLNKFLGGNPCRYNLSLRKVQGRNSIKDYLIIYSENDEIISQKYVKLEGVRSKKMRGSHVLLSYSPKIFREVADFLEGRRCQDV